MLATHSQHLNHLLGPVSPYHEAGPIAMSSSPSHSPASEIPRYFSEREYDDSLQSYSSPPSSVPSSHNASFSASGPYPAYTDFCQDPSYAFASSPLSHNGSQQQHQPQYLFQELPQMPMAEQHIMHEKQQAPFVPPYLPPQQHAHLQHLPPLPGLPPMHHSMMPMPHGQPILPYGEDLFMPAYQAPRAAMIPGLSMDRPEAKRRKTCPELTVAQSSPTPQRYESRRYEEGKKGAGKDGEDVWPEDVEVAFFESIRLVPKLGRKKIVVNSKPCGRNELISDYIRRKTGKIRSRKQVSSHIQVLKNIRTHDEEFMDLVAEPKAGEGEDDFSPETHRLFFLPQEFAHVPFEAPRSASSSSLSPMPSYPMEGLTPASMPARDGLLSPYCGGSFFAPSSGSSSPALSSCSSIPPTRSVSPYPMMVQTPSDELPQPLQVFQLKLAPPSPAAPAPSGAITGSVNAADANATPKSSPSKLGHRRVASRGLTLTIPPNAFAASQSQQAPPTIEEPSLILPEGDGSACASHPTTPWPQVLHTPTCAPPAPAMLGSPTQRRRLPQIWATTTADWNKASPALENNFEHELAAAVASSKSMQDAASRTSAPLKRSYTDMGASTTYDPFEHNDNLHSNKNDADRFFSNLLGSRDY